MIRKNGLRRSSPLLSPWSRKDSAVKRNPVSGSPLCLLFILLAWIVTGRPAVAQDVKDFIEVRSPRTLPAEKIPCQRIPLGEPEDYKPTIVLMPDGELVLSMFAGRRLENGKIAEQAILYRSADGGLTWSKRELPDIAGREPALSVTKDGTLFITAHLLGQDIRNKDGYTHSYLHRSEDGGRHWTSQRIEPERFRPRTVSLLTRNVLQLQDGSLIVGISEHAPKSSSVILRSTDEGKSWNSYGSSFTNVPANYPYTLYGEAHLWQARNGTLYAILRVGAGNSWPLAGTADPGTTDQSERMIVYSSKDVGRNWIRVQDLGSYGQMYMSILRLGQDRLLLTYTQRDIAPQLGIRAVPGFETDEGPVFDMKHDRIMVETRSPPGTKSGGGFGPTIQLKDGTLLTSYTYRAADNKKHAEVVRWRLPAFKAAGSQ